MARADRLTAGLQRDASTQPSCQCRSHRPSSRRPWS